MRLHCILHSTGFEPNHMLVYLAWKVSIIHPTLLEKRIYTSTFIITYGKNIKSL